jgi:CheY-like chemotaxis protein
MVGVLTDLTTVASPVSVLVVDEDPNILVFIARVLDASGMRALLARDGGEALEIAGRGDVPVDIVLTNAAIREHYEPSLLEQLHQVRTGIRELTMAACVEGGIFRVQPIQGGRGAEYTACHDGLVESIRRSASRPQVQRAGQHN